MTDQGMAPDEDAPALASTGKRAAVGCFTAILGVMSGGMVAVLLSKFVAFVTRAQSCPGIPTCDWNRYWVGGAVIGGLTLPLLVLRALAKPKKSS